MIISTQLRDVEVDRLDALARARGQSRSSLMKEAIAKLMGDLAEPASNPLHEVRTRSRKPATDGGS